jgi:predicted nucleic acid-binding protein
MDGYILDTNHLIPLLREKDDHRDTILKRLGAVPAESPVYIATATIAELEVGCCFRKSGRLESQSEIREAIRGNGVRVLDFTRHTAAEYGWLKAELMRKYNRRGVEKAAKWPEAWPHPDTGRTLDIDEMDLIIISHAVERNLVVVTSDKMNRILPDIRPAQVNLRFENWAGNASPRG